MEISCTDCHTSFHHTPQYATGDPRNIAIVGHWDGFRPFRSTGKHSCGKEYIQSEVNVIRRELLSCVCYRLCIDFTIATMAKCDRSSTEEVYIAGFVPSYLLPHKRPCSLDPFLHPLITEIEDLFINGEH